MVGLSYFVRFSGGAETVLIRMKRLAIILPLTLALAALSACGNDVKGAAQAGGPPPAMPVKYQVAQLQPVGDFTEYLATLKSRSAAVIQPQVDGNITRIFVKSGDKVAAGQPLIEIDPSKQEATVHSQQATTRLKQANLAYLKQELDRRKQLAAEGVIARQDLDQAQAQYDAAVADVEASGASAREQQVQLHYYTVRAPAAGTVGDIPVRVGDRVANTTVLTTVDKTGELEAYLYVPSEKSGAVHLGQTVDLLNDDGTTAGKTKVSFVSPRVDPQSQLLLVKAPVPNDRNRFKNDQLVHARLLWNEASRPLIPVTAVARVTGQTFAFIADDSKQPAVARQKAVKLGDVVGNNYVVLDGIKPGEKIITTGVQVLADGMPVNPQPSTQPPAAGSQISEARQ
jgi:RND family efflux transporter MFP subunit